MWIIYALASALFAGLVSILAKIGIKNTDSNLATALRTVVVAIFAWLMVFVVGSQTTIGSIDTRSLIFLILSGFATGASWLCYFKALQIGDVNKVVPVDKSSTVLTMLLSMIFLSEGITLIKIAAILLIGSGTYLMIERKETADSGAKGYSWLIYAALSAVFASLTAILGKVGIHRAVGPCHRAVLALLLPRLAGRPC
jgi:transporter family protein